MLSVFPLLTTTPKAIPHTRPKAVRFTGGASPSYEQELQEKSRRSREVMEKVYYEGDPETFTGADIFQALLKAGYKSLLKPTVTLNPFKWLQMGAALVTGDGYSQWVLPELIVKNLPLHYASRSSLEQAKLLAGVCTALSDMKSFGLVHLTDARKVPHFYNDLWRPAGSGKKLLSECKRQKALARPTSLQGEAKTVQKLQAHLEGQIQEIQKKQSALEKEHQATQSRFQAENEKLNALQTEVETLTAALGTKPELKNKRLSAQADVKLQEELCQALALKLDVSEELRLQYESETNQTTLKIKTALKRIEITRIHGETLQLSGKLKEKKELDDQLALQLLEAQTAYETIKSALAAENPEAFIALIRQVRLLEADPQSAAPFTLKVSAEQSPLQTKAQQQGT